jgi:hypothetical protein
MEYKMAKDSEKFIKAEFLKEILNIWKKCLCHCG